MWHAPQLQKAGKPALTALATLAFLLPVTARSQLAAAVAAPAPAVQVAAPAPAAEAAAPAPAAGIATPAPAADFAFVKSQIVFPARPEVTVIDTRPAHSGYDAGHIPGAIHVPDEQFERRLRSLPQDRKQLLIFYSEDAQRESSRQSAARAASLGYNNTRVYAAGFADWLKNGGQVAVSAAYIVKLKNDRTPHVLVDARPARTAAKGMIPGAINLPDAEFDKLAAKLPADKDTRLIFYCGGIDCPQSSSAAEKARGLGYTDVRTYPEGYPEWIFLHPPAPPGGN